MEARIFSTIVGGIWRPPLYLRPDTEVGPQLIGELCDDFLSNLLFPGTRLTTLWTKRPGEGQRLNIGEFDLAMEGCTEEILSGGYAVVRIAGETLIFRQKIAFFSACQSCRV